MSRAIEMLAGFVRTGELPPPATERAALDIVAAACRHGLAAPLDFAVSRQEAVWPHAACRVLREAYRADLFRGVQLLESGRRARALLFDAGLRTLPMKGGALQGWLYDSPAERPMLDVDLLLLDDWAEAVACLARAGFTVLERADHAWAFRDPASAVAIELHRGLASCPEMFPVDKEALWRRRVGAAGEEHPSPEDLLVQLSVHAAFQHGLDLRLVQYLDFRRLLERCAIRSGLLMDVAVTTHAEACVTAALEAAALLVGAPVPEALQHELQARAGRRLRARLGRLRRDPLAALRTSPCRVAGWRLCLVGERRLELIARTLAPSAAGPAEAPLARLGRSVSRSFSLLRTVYACMSTRRHPSGD